MAGVSKGTSTFALRGIPFKGKPGYVAKRFTSGYGVLAMLHSIPMSAWLVSTCVA